MEKYSLLAGVIEMADGDSVLKLENPSEEKPWRLTESASLFFLEVKNI